MSSYVLYATVNISGSAPRDAKHKSKAVLGRDEYTDLLFTSLNNGFSTRWELGYSLAIL